MTDTNTIVNETVTEQTAAPKPVQPLRKDFSNLRNRPFLVINTIQRPVKKGITSRKGWADAAGNWQIFENPQVVDRVSNKILREATVIIDVTRSTCVKNRFDQVTDTEVVHHYMGKYGEQVKEALGLWMRKMAQKMAQDPKFASRLAEKATEQAHAQVQAEVATAIAQQDADAAAEAAQSAEG